MHQSGAFRNKYLSVARASNDWVYLLDSDNKLQKFYRYTREYSRPRS